MSRFIDLSHDFEDGMPGFTMRSSDADTHTLTARIRTFLTHEQSAPLFDGKASFELTEMTFQTSIGTYLDAPRHRYADRRDIAGLALSELVRPAVVIDATHALPAAALNPDDVHWPASIRDRAVLVRFGWDRHWRTAAYDHYPFLSRHFIERLISGGARLVGVDTFNIDDRYDPVRPAHSLLLERDILIVENLCNLHRLPENEFHFFAIPIKAKGAAAMPIRAFAEVLEAAA